MENEQYDEEDYAVSVNEEVNILGVDLMVSSIVTISLLG